MRIHYLQHVPFESLESISVWAEKEGHQVTGTLLYEYDRFPSFKEFDLLVILGGPMGVNDEELFPWLVEEKVFIKEAIRLQKLVLGICLGAQLIAESIGGKVYKNDVKEIGWFPVKVTDAAKCSSFFKEAPESFIPFHWHADTFHLPAAAKTIAFSKGCANQVFEYEGHVIGLQFHLESTETSINNLITHCEGEMETGTYVQLRHEMVGRTELLARSNAILFTLLDALEANYRLRSVEQMLGSNLMSSFRIIED